MFRTVPLSIIRSFFTVHSNGICHTACEQDQDGRTDPARKLSANLYDIYRCCVYSDDGQRNCPKHVEFYSKNKFEKLVHVISLL